MKAKSLYFLFGLFFVFTANAEKQILNYGHRGCRGLRPENTIPAYKKALEIGVDYVDMDVNMTKDGIVVVTHNSALNPDFTRDKNGSWITSKKLYIKDMTYSEIKTYDVGRANPDSKYAKIFKNQKPVDGTHIPTLKEVIKYVKKWNKKHGANVKFNIELKTMPFGLGHYTPSVKLADAVYKIIKEEGIIDTTEIQDFDWTALVHLNTKDRKVKTAYLVIPPLGIGEGTHNNHNTYSEVLDPKSEEKLLEENYKLIGLESEKVKLLIENGTIDEIYDAIAKAIKDLGGSCIESMLLFTSKTFIDATHKYNLKAVPWDSEALTKKDFNKSFAEAAIKNGADGIITDRPDLLKKIIAPAEAKL